METDSTEEENKEAVKKEEVKPVKTEKDLVRYFIGLSVCMFELKGNAILPTLCSLILLLS